MGDHDTLIAAALDRMRADGFRGIRTTEHHRVNNGMHTLALVAYRFDDGTLADYLEASEYHPDAEQGAVVVAMTEAVHALRNLGPDFWRVVMRERIHAFFRDVVA